MIETYPGASVKQTRHYTVLYRQTRLRIWWFNSMQKSTYISLHFFLFSTLAPFVSWFFLFTLHPHYIALVRMYRSDDGRVGCWQSPSSNKFECWTLVVSFETSCYISLLYILVYLHSGYANKTGVSHIRMSPTGIRAHQYYRTAIVVVRIGVLL